MKDLIVKLRKLWTPEIFWECLLCSDQSQIKMCEQTTKPQTNYRCCWQFSYLMSDWLLLDTITFQHYYLCSQFSEFDSTIYWGQRNKLLNVPSPYFFRRFFSPSWVVLGHFLLPSIVFLFFLIEIRFITSNTSVSVTCSCSTATITCCLSIMAVVLTTPALVTPLPPSNPLPTECLHCTPSLFL